MDLELILQTVARLLISVDMAHRLLAYNIDQSVLTQASKTWHIRNVKDNKEATKILQEKKGLVQYQHMLMLLGTAASIVTWQ